MKRLYSFYLFVVLATGFEVGNASTLATQIESELKFEEILREAPEISDSLDAEQRQELLLRTSEHKVAALKHLQKYDNQKIGFCYGRAMTAHLIARKMGLRQRSIRKLFVIGDLRSGDVPEWRFHVTTLVKGSEDGLYYAIDPIMRPPRSDGKPLPPAKWIEIVKSIWDKNHKAHFYVSTPESVMPDMRVVPTVKDLDQGNRIIELSFNPNLHAGLNSSHFGAHEYFEVDARAQEDYFINTRELNQTPFNFLFFDMLVKRPNEQKLLHLVYNNYFVDLLADLKLPLLEKPISRQTKARSIEIQNNDLHGIYIGP